MISTIEIKSIRVIPSKFDEVYTFLHFNIYFIIPIEFLCHSIGQGRQGHGQYGRYDIYNKRESLTCRC